VKTETETKRKLLEAAVSLIWESSYGSVSVDDICQKAGVNKGSFYHAFKSKADLAVAAYERHWQALQPRLDQIFSPQVPALQRLDDYCDFLFEGQENMSQSAGKLLGCPFCSLGSELSTQNENIRLKAGQITARLARYIESAVRDLAAEGSIQAADTTELAREISVYLSGAIMQAKIENSLVPLRSLKKGLHRLLNVKEVASSGAI
jgi:TetR/AcrR family transcriptional repressor of nem operon